MTNNAIDIDGEGSDMIRWILAVLSFQLIGEVSATLLDLTVPGPVIGMVLMFGLLVALGETPAPLQRLTDGVLKHLYLYFVPASVGVTAYIALVADQLVAIVTAVVVSSAVAMLVTGHVMQALIGKGDDDAV